MIASVALAWYVVRRDQARRQQQAVAAIEAAGGWVRYDFQRDGQAELGGPEWLRQRLGVDFFHRVVSASLPTDFAQAAMLTYVEELELIGGDFTGENLAPLSELPRLLELRLRGRRLHPEGFEQITAARRLEVFDPGSLSFDGLDLRLLERLSRIRELVFAHSDLDEASLAGLANLTELESLKLAGGEVTDDAIRHLAGLTSLRRLQLRHCPLTDQCLAHLGGLHELRELDLSYTRITGRGLAHLRELKALQSLDLTSTRFEDASIPHVRRLPGLAELYLAECPVTIDGIERLTRIDHLRRLDPGRKPITDADLPSLKRLAAQNRVVLIAGGSWLEGGSVDLGLLWHMSQLGYFDIDAIVAADQFESSSFVTAQFSAQLGANANLVQARSQEWRIQWRQKRASGK